MLIRVFVLTSHESKKKKYIYIRIYILLQTLYIFVLFCLHCVALSTLQITGTKYQFSHKTKSLNLMFLHLIVSKLDLYVSYFNKTRFCLTNYQPPFSYKTQPFYFISNDRTCDRSWLLDAFWKAQLIGPIL